MKKREAEAVAASKPVFLSKKQREELALKRRQVRQAICQLTSMTAIQKILSQLDPCCSAVFPQAFLCLLCTITRLPFAQ